MENNMEPYRPGNGTEGRMFEAAYCDRCVRDEVYDEPCEIHGAAYFLDIEDEGYPRDTWVYFSGEPTCLAFRERGGGDAPVPDDPAQGDLFMPLPVLTS